MTAWDFYPCLVDERPASVYLDLAHVDRLVSKDVDTLYWVHFEMLDAGAHGMGTETEAAVLHSLTDRLVEALTARGLVYVARLRNHGRWQLTFYGAAGHEQPLRDILGSTDTGGRRVTTGAKPDAAWAYYHEFLLPGPERAQWMQDRHVVEALTQAGDDLARARRVDHWLSFPSHAQADAFLVEAARAGFEAVRNYVHDPESDSATAHWVQVFRDDIVELDHVHTVVMTLFELAATHHGTYDGWESQVQGPADN